jgi:hypothetical protein
MNNVMDMLTKSGYEAVSIGNDVLPCTLKKGNELVGFMMEDFSLKLLPEHEAQKESLQKAISFALDNQGLEEIQGEYKLSQYQDVLFTTTYDFEAEKPIYNIYYEDEDKNLVLRGSSNDKNLAAQDFASRSGLVVGQIPTPAHEADRIQKFIDAIKEKGYSLAESVHDAYRAYEIIDQDNHIVGYIGKDNRVTVITDDAKTKRFLTDTYIDTNPNKVMLPSFFEKLKEHLKEIGLALKVIFTSKGRHYAIQNEQQKEIATVNEKHEVTYTDQATKEQMAKINAMVEEIRRENHEKQEVTQQKEPVAEVVNQEIPAPVSPVIPQTLTVHEVQNLASMIFANPTLTEVFIQAIQSDRGFLTKVREEIGNVQPVFSEQQLDQGNGRAEKGAAESVKQPEIVQQFVDLYSLLLTLDGFNPERYDAVKAEMIAKFGTADHAEFEKKFQRGDYKEPSTLSDRLKVSQEKADRQNTAAVQERPAEQTKEQQTKERE